MANARSLIQGLLESPEYAGGPLPAFDWGIMLRDYLERVNGKTVGVVYANVVPLYNYDGGTELPRHIEQMFHDKHWRRFVDNTELVHAAKRNAGVVFRYEDFGKFPSIEAELKKLYRETVEDFSEYTTNVNITSGDPEVIRGDVHSAKVPALLNKLGLKFAVQNDSDDARALIALSGSREPGERLVQITLGYRGKTEWPRTFVLATDAQLDKLRRAIASSRVSEGKAKAVLESPEFLEQPLPGDFSIKYQLARHGTETIYVKPVFVAADGTEYEIPWTWKAEMYGSGALTPPFASMKTKDLVDRLYSNNQSVRPEDFSKFPEFTDVLNKFHQRVKAVYDRLARHVAPENARRIERREISGSLTKASNILRDNGFKFAELLNASSSALRAIAPMLLSAEPGEVAVEYLKDRAYPKLLVLATEQGHQKFARLLASGTISESPEYGIDNLPAEPTFKYGLMARWGRSSAYLVVSLAAVRHYLSDYAYRCIDLTPEQEAFTVSAIGAHDAFATGDATQFATDELLRKYPELVAQVEAAKAELSARYRKLVANYRRVIPVTPTQIRNKLSDVYTILQDSGAKYTVSAAGSGLEHTIQGLMLDKEPGDTLRRYSTVNGAIIYVLADEATQSKIARQLAAKTVSA